MHRKRIEASSGAMHHTTKHSSVKHTLRCAHIVYLVCCVGESFCATSHLLYVSTLPCCCGGTQRPLYATRRKPKCICLPSVAKRCMEGPRQITVVFLNCGFKPLRYTLNVRFGAFGSLHNGDFSGYSVLRMISRSSHCRRIRSASLVRLSRKGVCAENEYKNYCGQTAH